MDDSTKARVEHTLAKATSAVIGLQDSVGENFYSAVEILQNRKGKIIVTGVGKSAFVGMKMTATLISLGQMAQFLHPVEALHGDSGIVVDGDVILALSFSGESAEVVKIVSYLKKSFDVHVVSITGNTTSQLAQLSDKHIHISISEEGSPLNLAPMSSTTATIVVGDMLASALTSPLHFEKHHFAKFHPGGSLGLQLTRIVEVMSSGGDIPIVRDSDSLNDALLEMSRTSHTGFVGVVDQSGKLSGIVTDGDIRRYIIKNGNVENKIVKHVMTPNPKTINENQSLQEGLTLMEKHKITSLFVLGEMGNPTGVVHMHDIIENYIV